MSDHVLMPLYTTKDGYKKTRVLLACKDGEEFKYWDKRCNSWVYHVLYATHYTDPVEAVCQAKAFEKGNCEYLVVRVADAEDVYIKSMIKEEW